MGYLEVVKGGKEQNKKVNVPGHLKDKNTNLHPSLKSSLTELGERYFAGLILEDQDCFAGEQGWTIFLGLLPDKEVAEIFVNSRAASHPIQHPSGRILNARL